MNRINILSFYRALTRDKVHSFLNISGLALGIAVLIVLGLYVRFETSFERWLPGHEKIYLVQTEWKGRDGPYSGTFQSTMGSLLDEMKADFPDVTGTRILGGKDGGSVVRDGVANFEDIAEVDADFLNVFGLPLIAGDKTSALSAPNSVIISRSIAEKYFGSDNPVGKSLQLAVDQEAEQYEVTGVFEDLPANTNLEFSIVARLPSEISNDWWSNWGSTSVRTYLRFDTPEAASAFEQRLSPFIARRGARDLGSDAADQLGLPLLPITQVHFSSEGTQSSGKEATVLTLAAVGVFTLLIAIVNYVNLASARASLRAREVAVRKALGASRSLLIRQFLGEAIVVVAIAAFFGVILAELGLPFVNAVGGLSLSLPYGLVVPLLIGLVLVVGLLAGLYPALILSGIPAAEALASARTPGGGRKSHRARELLVVLQFTVVIAFLIGTAVFVSQMRHIKTNDLGFDREGLIVLSSFGYIDRAQRSSVLEEIRRTPGVLEIGTANNAVGGAGPKNSDNIAIPGRQGAGPSLRRIDVGSDFFQTYSPTLLAGRLFDDAFRMDDSSELGETDSRNIVIDELAVTALGFATPEDAIGQTVGSSPDLTIVGVIDRLSLFSPRLQAEPTYFVYYRGLVSYPIATARVAGNSNEMVDAISQSWRRSVPDTPIKIETGKELLDGYYREDDQATRLFAIGAALAVLIGVIGLWGLASFNTARRIREVGIRKSLGATSGDIVKLMIGHLMRPVLVANLIAWPIAYIFMQSWLADFADPIALSPFYFAAGTLLALAIAVLTVLWQSLRASRTPPAWALRHD